MRTALRTLREEHAALAALLQTLLLMTAQARAGGKGSRIPRGAIGGLVKDGDVGHLELGGERGELLPIGARGDTHELELVGVRGDHPQRVLADRAGGAEQDDAFATGKGHAGDFYLELRKSGTNRGEETTK